MQWPKFSRRTPARNIFLELTKSGIAIFVVLEGLAGYALGLTAENGLAWTHLLCFALGLYCLSSGSLALNQAQEAELDARMPRTRARPIPSGRLSKSRALAISVFLIGVGLAMLGLLRPLLGLLGLLSVLLYNGLYTYYWKPKWIYAAVPGALPGALPVVLGYAATHAQPWTVELLYAFLIVFLWQMPHFWAIALRYREDYRAAGIPTLPVTRGTDVTLRQITLYTLALVALATLSPLLVTAHWAYLLAVLPFCTLTLWQLGRYVRSEWQGPWFRFFLCVNTAMLVFIVAPVVDKFWR